MNGIRMIFRFLLITITFTFMLFYIYVQRIVGMKIMCKVRRGIKVVCNQYRDCHVYN